MSTKQDPKNQTPNNQIAAAQEPADTRADSTTSVSGMAVVAAATPLTADAALEEPLPPSVTPGRLLHSLERHRTEFEQLGDSNLISINTDVPSAAMLVLKRAPDWQHLLPRIQKLPEVDHPAVANLEGYAEATLQANADYMTTVAPPAELSQLLVEGDQMRDDLREDAAVLERRGLLPKGSIDEIKGLPGYRNTAVELSALVTLLRNNQASIAGKTAITPEELDRAGVIAQKIFRNAADRSARHPRQLRASLLRQQAFTAMHRAYDELRRCIAFLVPDPKLANAMAPSFYQGRGGRPAQRANEPTTTTPAEQSPPEGDATDESPAVDAQADTPLAVNVPGPNALPSNNPFTS